MRGKIAALTLAVTWLASTSPSSAIEWRGFEGSARGFPVLLDLDGRRLADGGRDRIRMAKRTIAATPPAGFLRWEGPLALPDDPMVRVDLLPGGQSGPAVVAIYALAQSNS